LGYVGYWVKFNPIETMHIFLSLGYWVKFNPITHIAHENKIKIFTQNNDI